MKLKTITKSTLSATNRRRIQFAKRVTFRNFACSLNKISAGFLALALMLPSPAFANRQAATGVSAPVFSKVEAELRETLGVNGAKLDSMGVPLVNLSRDPVNQLRSELRAKNINKTFQERIQNLQQLIDQNAGQIKEHWKQFNQPLAKLSDHSFYAVIRRLEDKNRDYQDEINSLNRFWNNSSNEGREKLAALLADLKKKERSLNDLIVEESHLMEKPKRETREQFSKRIANLDRLREKLNPLKISVGSLTKKIALLLKSREFFTEELSSSSRTIARYEARPKSSVTLWLTNEDLGSDVAGYGALAVDLNGEKRKEFVELLKAIGHEDWVSNLDEASPEMLLVEDREGKFHIPAISLYVGPWHQNVVLVFNPNLMSREQAERFFTQKALQGAEGWSHFSDQSYQVIQGEIIVNRGNNTVIVQIRSEVRGLDHEKISSNVMEVINKLGQPCKGLNEDNSLELWGINDLGNFKTALFKKFPGLRLDHLNWNADVTTVENVINDVEILLGAQAIEGIVPKKYLEAVNALVMHQDATKNWSSVLDWLMKANRDIGVDDQLSYAGVLNRVVRSITGSEMDSFSRQEILGDIQYRFNLINLGVPARSEVRAIVAKVGDHVELIEAGEEDRSKNKHWMTLEINHVDTAEGQVTFQVIRSLKSSSLQSASFAIHYAADDGGGIWDQFNSQKKQDLQVGTKITVDSNDYLGVTDQAVSDSFLYLQVSILTQPPKLLGQVTILLPSDSLFRLIRPRSKSSRSEARLSASQLTQSTRVHDERDALFAGFQFNHLNASDERKIAARVGSLSTQVAGVFTPEFTFDRNQPGLALIPFIAQTGVIIVQNEAQKRAVEVLNQTLVKQGRLEFAIARNGFEAAQMLHQLSAQRKLVNGTQMTKTAFVRDLTSHFVSELKAARLSQRDILLVTGAQFNYLMSQAGVNTSMTHQIGEKLAAMGAVSSAA